ncbi:MAG: bifunctional methionine sulfoxide reductase B/A protein [Gammaproteobacteria bacterium]|nr:bifunctional methionine sulfoxide reductase B/A protein [Gammaproteobacteria bacterium]
MDKTASLMPSVLGIIQDKETEHPFTGEYCMPQSEGTYLCRRCGLALFRAHDQFHSGCGWPSFDLEISGQVKRLPDEDGRRTEILCMRCDAHLGHVFTGEQHTERNLRHCVNSLSLDFTSDQTVLNSGEIILAAGCFWGVEYYLKRLSGVLKTEVGYMGGHLSHPSYEAVCQKNTGHLEVLRVLFDPEKISMMALLRYFFEIHDPCQRDGQGPDLGPQYYSAIFYYTPEQREVAEKVMQQLIQQGLDLATKLYPVSVFWPAEAYHQDYYQKNNKAPYCHHWVKRF